MPSHETCTSVPNRADDATSAASLPWAGTDDASIISSHPTVLPVLVNQADESATCELVVISGKGGTGKTSVVASFAALASDTVVADCDVDAADLHLVLAPEIREQHGFVSGYEASIRQDACDGCGVCCAVCRFDAVKPISASGICAIDPIACEGCGVCVEFCPTQAIDFRDRNCGEWFISDTRFGPMIHARLGIAAENSGRLVTLVRQQAKRIALERGCSTILIDGPPGIGCPVIAAMTGAQGALLVTEPTVSGIHDLERVLELTGHFDITASVCVNRWDLYPEASDRIEAIARTRGAIPVGRIRYDPTVTRAQIEGKAVVELGGNAADDIRVVWERVKKLYGPTAQ